MALPVATTFITDYKRFLENLNSVCPSSATTKLYSLAPWNTFRTIYVRIKSGSEYHTVAIPRDATVGNFCAFVANESIDILGYVDASEFWLFWFGVVVLIWTILAWRAYYQGNCYVPLWYVLILLIIGIYMIARSTPPAVSNTKTFNNFVP